MPGECSRRYFLLMGRIGELRWGTVADVALVGFIVAATWLGVFTAHNPVSTHIAGPRWLAIAFALVIALPLFWRRARPLLVCAVIAAGIVADGDCAARKARGRGSHRSRRRVAARRAGRERRGALADRARTARHRRS